ncbi:hypothetical protein ACQ9LF_04360 [Anaerohalosphaeraceae bacterium U12dextr]
MMKKLMVSLAVIAFCAMSLQAVALPAYSSQVQQITTTFSPVYGTGSAEVTSTVYAATGGGYIYAYEIKNATNTFSWFSVALLPGAVVTGTGYDAGTNDPTSWTTVGVPATSVEGLFAIQIAPGVDSSVVWFTSPGAPTRDLGSLTGLGTKGTFNYLEGGILTPIPEPMTMVLLGAGWLALRTCGRKR